MPIQLAVLVAAAVLTSGPAPARADPGVAADRAGRVYFTTGQPGRPYFVPDGELVAADSLLRAGPRGRLATVATFAPRTVRSPAGTLVTMRSVPDAVVRGPDGAFYVGERTSFPFPVGQARVWRVVPGHPPTVYAAGFTCIVGLNWTADHRLQVRELGR